MVQNTYEELMARVRKLREENYSCKQFTLPSLECERVIPNVELEIEVHHESYLEYEVIRKMSTAMDQTANEMWAG